MPESFAFPYPAIIKRFNVDAFYEIGNTFCDVTPSTTEREFVGGIISSRFFQVHTISSPVDSQILFADRLVVPKYGNKEFFIRRENDMTPEPVVEYKEIKASLNTLLLPEYQTIVQREIKGTTENYDQITGERYGPDSGISFEDFIMNVEASFNSEDFMEREQQGIQIEVDLFAFTDRGDEIAINDILIVNGEKYSVKYNLPSAFKIWTLGLESLRNQTL